MDKSAAQVRWGNAISAAAARKPAAGKSAQDAAGRNAADVALQGVTITHPDRVMDPSSGLTKADLARYYDAVAPFILPYLKNRPVYLLRSPSGIEGKSFFQRHAIRTAIPGIDLLDQSVDPEHQQLMVINSAQALLSAALMGAIELHSCNATADRIERPDCMIFDLDPDPALSWDTIVESALLLRHLLDGLGLRSFVKTSGGKGLHIAVPLARRHAWEDITDFTEAVARHLERVFPSCFIVKMGERNREGKIYIDYLRNQKMASTVVPYSARARKGLPVSAPIAWEELGDIDGASAWTIASMPARLERLRKDPWEDFLRTRQSVTNDMKRLLAG